jgi:hypothetical protein
VELIGAIALALILVRRLGHSRWDGHSAWWSPIQYADCRISPCAT